MCVALLVRVEIFALDEAVDVEEPDPVARFALARSLELHGRHDRVGDADAGRSRAEEEER